MATPTRKKAKSSSWKKVKGKAAPAESVNEAKEAAVPPDKATKAHKGAKGDARRSGRVKKAPAGRTAMGI